MFFKECPFCHRNILALLYPIHRMTHMRLKADGQMTDHITMRQEARFAGPLDNVPMVYEHSACGGHTRMPEEIIRSYLANPFLYGGESFCCGCGKYIPVTDLFWVETRQCLADYNRELKAEYLRTYGKPPRMTRV
jgi:hypothetical protein